MNPYFKTKKILLEKEITSTISALKKTSQADYVWSKSALNRFEKFILPGKMIRGLLVMLSAGDGKNNVEQDAIKIGTALEIMHSGILIHDDIIDRDSKRRGLPTMHYQYSQMAKKLSEKEALHYGEGMASCIGIIGYFMAIGQFAKLKNVAVQNQLLSLFSSEMALLGLGQMDDLDTGTMHAVNELDCLRIYEQKTGRYTFGLPILAGLTLAGKMNSKTEKLVYEISKSLGIIFQLRDDYLGIFGDHKKTGKSVGGDIVERKKTWFYFTTLKVANKQDAKKLRELYNNHKTINSKDKKWVLQIMEQYNLPELAKTELNSQKLIALDILGKLPFSTKQKSIMQDLVEQLITRVK